jgi:hypothetical protein
MKGRGDHATNFLHIRRRGKDRVYVVVANAFVANALENENGTDECAKVRTGLEP